MTDGNGQQGGDGTQSGGADEARAYIPPQVVKAKAKPVLDDKKVRIKEGIDPRKVTTQRSLATAGGHQAPPDLVPPQPDIAEPARVVPATVPAITPVAGPAAPATPFETPPEPPPVVAADAALPFRPAAAEPPINGGGVAAAPTGFAPKQPPLQLGAPGVLSGPSAAAKAPASPAAAVATAAPAAAAPSPAPVAPPPPAAAEPPVVQPPAEPPVVQPPAEPPVVQPPAEPPVVQPPPPEPPAVQSPPVEASTDPVTADMPEPAVAAPSSDPSAEPQPAPEPQAAAAPPPAPRNEDGEHPLATTNSPWSADKTVSAELLPSANILPSAQATPSPVPPAPAERVESSHGSRVAMTIGLAIAALALVGAVVYFTMDKGGDGDDPADVKAGREQIDHGDMPATSAAPSSTASAKPRRPPRLRVPTRKTATKPPPEKKPKSEDIYDGL